MACGRIFALWKQLGLGCSGPELTSDSDSNAEDSMGADLSWTISSLQTLSLSEFWLFPHGAGGCSFSENRKSCLMTMNVPSWSTVQPPLVFKAKVIFPCWCLIIATRLDGAGNYQSTVCYRCLSNHSLYSILGPGKTNEICVFSMAFLCLHFIHAWSPQWGPSLLFKCDKE